MMRRRRAQVEAALTRVRAAVGDRPHDPTPEAAQLLRTILTDLAADAKLWAVEDFPIGGDRLWGVYEVHEDPDGRFALYASAAHPGHAQPPHNHTTWACIAGVAGVEINRLYRIDAGGRIPGPSRLTKVAEIPVGPGDSIFLGPDDVHDICVAEPESAMHLHLYGLGLPRLDRRLRHDLTAGTCEYFPVFSGIPRLAG